MSDVVTPLGTACRGPQSQNGRCDCAIGASRRFEGREPHARRLYGAGLVVAIDQKLAADAVGAAEAAVAGRGGERAVAQVIVILAGNGDLVAFVGGIVGRRPVRGSRLLRPV